jgi:hypothetical protein
MRRTARGPYSAAGRTLCAETGEKQRGACYQRCSRQEQKTLQPTAAIEQNPFLAPQTGVAAAILL